MERTGEFVILGFSPTGREPLPIAVLLLDCGNDRLHVRTREDLNHVSGPEDGPVLRGFLEQLANEAPSNSGNATLEALESSLSNSVRITERRNIHIVDIEDTLDRLAALHFSQAK